MQPDRHGGVNQGFQSVFATYEKSGEGAVVMTNSDRAMEVAEEVMRSVAAEYGWPDFKPVERTALHVDPKELAGVRGDIPDSWRGRKKRSPM